MQQEFSGHVDGKALALFVETKRIEAQRREDIAKEKADALRAYLRHIVLQ